MNYSTETKMTEMHLIYGLVNRNAEEPRRIYQDRHSNRVIPYTERFKPLQARLCEMQILINIQVILIF